MRTFKKLISIEGVEICHNKREQERNITSMKDLIKERN